MKALKIFLVSLVLSFNFCSGVTQNFESEYSLNKHIDELYELKAKQNPQDIDYASGDPKSASTEYTELKKISESRDFNGLFTNDIPDKLSFSEFLKYNPRIASGTSLVNILGWVTILLYATLGWILLKRKRLFIGKMILSSLVPLCLIYLFAVNMDLSYYPYAWALAMMIMGGIMLLSIECIYIYGYGIIIFIYNRYETKYRVVWLISSILLCSILPPLFIIPIIYLISKGYLKTEDCQCTDLYKLMPYLCGLLFGLIISIPFYAITVSLGHTIRETLYYLQYLW